ncbi:hypothetical protein EXT47_09085 [Pseudoalteromonas sp. CO342X]|uniref:RipA family octameric membrane protein n=1 Tax=Pseudoalteromonas sp. CO342X TaxID=1777270 RepID=UPI001022B898|nr:hypothetical protein [Pseudoalteromonas sp. CO342X]RZG15591.1 hypothetical protein EXT47_09085 [Pseudoalteromonas sp. CO342X]
MPTTPLSQQEYEDKFLKDDAIRRNAHQLALDVRKFEIELYWKRATYFWTFIAAALAGFAAIQVSTAEAKTDLSVVLSCLGLVFSVGWLCVNRGSKHWQENWENHVDLLEDKECGPIYKVIVKRRTPQSKMELFEHLLNGPSEFSVSKINQLISLYVSILWVLLVFYSLPEFYLPNTLGEICSSINWFYVIIIFFTIAICASFFFKFGATYEGGYWHRATIRTSRINNDNSANTYEPYPVK